MPVTVVVGGQFGSEGKGKVAHFFAQEQRAKIAVRVGGSNSGHTVVDSRGIARVFRVLPTASVLDHVICVLGAGTYIDVDVLFSEISTAGLNADRLMIDPNAYVISEGHKQTEQEWGIRERIGSTQSGTGAAVVERVQRLSAAHLAKHEPRLTKFVKPVRPFLRSAMDRGDRVIIEGTQGFGLSLLHSDHYPKATSRDTTAGAFVSEAGVSPLDVDEIVLVARAFPIRVPGQSGDLPSQTEWPTIAAEAGWPSRLVERTSVTDQVRRVARFEATVVRAAIETNWPTKIVLNHADYFDFESHRTGAITAKVATEVSKIASQLNGKLNLIGLGPDHLCPWDAARYGLPV